MTNNRPVVTYQDSSSQPGLLRLPLTMILKLEPSPDILFGLIIHGTRQPASTLWDCVAHIQAFDIFAPWNSKNEGLRTFTRSLRPYPLCDVIFAIMDLFAKTLTTGYNPFGRAAIQNTKLSILSNPNNLVMSLSTLLRRLLPKQCGVKSTTSGMLSMNGATPTATATSLSTILPTPDVPRHWTLPQSMFKRLNPNQYGLTIPLNATVLRS